jgi:hypothetical protein
MNSASFYTKVQVLKPNTLIAKTVSWVWMNPFYPFDVILVTWMK